MITILTDDDLIKNMEEVDKKKMYNGYEFSNVPRETLLKSIIVLHINSDGDINFLKNRYTDEEALRKLKEIGFNYTAKYSVLT